MRNLLLFLFSGCALALSPESAGRKFLESFEARHYEEAAAVAAEALREHPNHPTLLGLLGMASAQIPGGIEFALDTWRKAVAEGATISIPGYRYPNIRTGLNLVKALRLGMKPTTGALVISATEVRFLSSEAGQEFRLPMANLGVSDMPGMMSVATAGYQGYDGATWDTGSIFLSGKVDGRKVDIPVHLMGSGRKIISGWTRGDSLDWEIQGTGWLAYLCIQSIRRPGDLPRKLAPQTRHAERSLRARNAWQK